MKMNTMLKWNNAFNRLFTISLVVGRHVEAFNNVVKPATLGPSFAVVSPLNCRHLTSNQSSKVNQNYYPTFSPRRSHHAKSKISYLRMNSSAHSIEKPLRKGLVTIASTSSLVLIDVAFRRLLKSLSISFPSSLAGCGALLTTMLITNAVKEEWGDYIYGLLAPGAALLARWLPVFFVPSLVTLPLAESLGSSVEILKVAGTIIAGFFFTLFTTAYSIIGVRKLTSGDKKSVPEPEPITSDGMVSLAPPTKAFTDSTFQFLSASAVIGGLASILASRGDMSPLVTTPLQALFMLFTTLSTFVFGARLPKSFTKLVHPLVTCTSLTWVIAKVTGMVTKSSFSSILRSYKASTLCPVHLGAGDLLLFMLGPAVVALACQMYDRKKLIKENIIEIGTAVTVSSVGGLFGTAAMVRSLGIKNPVLRLCMLSRNITSPLAMAIAGILGADVSLAVSMVVVTGLIGANFGASILDAVGIKDAVARGMGIGAAAHGLGTAAFANEEDAFPFAAISMALTASACTMLVSVPTIKNAVMKIALGI